MTLMVADQSLKTGYSKEVAIRLGVGPRTGREFLAALQSRGVMVTSEAEEMILPMSKDVFVGEGAIATVAASVQDLGYDHRVSYREICGTALANKRNLCPVELVFQWHLQVKCSLSDGAGIVFATEGIESKKTIRGVCGDSGIGIERVKNLQYLFCAKTSNGVPVLDVRSIVDPNPKKRAGWCPSTIFVFKS